MALIEQAEAAEKTDGSRFDFGLLACGLSAALMVGCASAVWYETLFGPIAFAYRVEVFWWSFGLAVLVPSILAWRYAAKEGRVGWTPWGEPKPDHLSGGGVVLLLALVSIVAGLALWAANSPDNNRTIHQSYGLAVVWGLVGLFLAAAFLPSLPRLWQGTSLAQAVNQMGTGIGGVLRAVLGRPLSFLDAVLVYGVAGGVGAGRSGFIVRYVLLLAAIAPAAVLGFLLPAPWAFIPLAWGLLVALAVSRRWVWIEEDRERVMLTPRYPRSQVRIGFEQDLRDEALISFLFMFLIVPVALRQLHLWSAHLGTPLFIIGEAGDVDNILDWIGFYGTELAKAIPFVDWAEIYDVSGEASIAPQKPNGLHVVFITRVMIDLVILAALLQALAIVSRNQRERKLFAEGKLDFLDPFAEPTAFRSLVTRDAGGPWRLTSEADPFAQYNADRLVELSDDKDERVREAARLLMAAQGTTRSKSFALAHVSAAQPLDIQAVRRALEEVRALEPHPNLHHLDLARRRLIGRTSAQDVRLEIVHLIANAPLAPGVSPSDHRRAQINFLSSVLRGPDADRRQQVRYLALDALEPSLAANDFIRTIFKHVATSDNSRQLRQKAQAVLDNHPEIA
jgi:hypothetical protein